MRLIIATLFALSLSVSAFATKKTPNKDESTVLLEKVGEKKVQLRFLEIPSGKVMVRIKNGQSGVIFKDVITSDKYFAKNYDLSALAEGDYKVEVISSKGGTLGDMEVSLGAEKAKSDYFTKLKVVDDRHIALLIKANDGSKKVVRILDKGNVIFEEAFVGNKFGKLFKFEKVKSLEDLTFEVRDEAGHGEYISAL